MSRWRDRSTEVERELKALNQADFGLSYGDELLRTVRGKFRLHVGIGGMPNSPFSAILAFGSEPLAPSALPRAIARILFGDEALIFDVAERLRGVCNPQAAIIGGTPWG